MGGKVGDERSYSFDFKLLHKQGETDVVPSTSDGPLLLPILPSLPPSRRTNLGVANNTIRIAEPQIGTRREPKYLSAFRQLFPHLEGRTFEMGRQISAETLKIDAVVESNHRASRGLVPWMVKEWPKHLVRFPVGPQVSIMGDGHMGNLGFSQSADGTGRLGLVDFEEIGHGSPYFDLVRQMVDMRAAVQDDPALHGANWEAMSVMVASGYREGLGGADPVERLRSMAVSNKTVEKFLEAYDEPESPEDYMEGPSKYFTGNLPQEIRKKGDGPLKEILLDPKPLSIQDVAPRLLAPMGPALTKWFGEAVPGQDDISIEDIKVTNLAKYLKVSSTGSQGNDKFLVQLTYTSDEGTPYTAVLQLKEVAGGLSRAQDIATAADLAGAAPFGAVSLAMGGEERAFIAKPKGFGSEELDIHDFLEDGGSLGQAAFIMGAFAGAAHRSTNLDVADELKEIASNVEFTQALEKVSHVMAKDLFAFRRGLGRQTRRARRALDGALD